MSGHINYFESRGKNRSFMIENDNIFVKYNEIWNKFKRALNTKYNSMPVYDEKYIKSKRI